MGRINTIARRTFLISSIAVAGGVAFGVIKIKAPAPNPLTSTDDATSLNAWVIILTDGVTVITPKAEMGQGVQTTWAALVAEELDIAWEDITVEHGPPAQAYYNSALFGLALPFLDHRVNGLKHAVRKFAGNGAKLLSLQLTAGSTSMRDGYERMRIAGATARETLKEAAAQRLGVNRWELTTRNGAVISPDGTSLPYQDLAVEAAEIDPPKVELRSPSEWKYLGKNMPRLDMVDKVAGTAEFGIDVMRDGMQFASVRMSPTRSGMRAFDASAAEAMDGVIKVLDLGEGVAVVAKNTWIAMRAVNSIIVEWEDAEYPPTTDAIHAKVREAFDLEPNSRFRDDGDTDDPQDGTEVHAEYSVPFLAHMTMEPMTATAQYSAAGLEVWCGNQAPGSVQSACAKEVGLAPGQVTLYTTLMGCGLGRRSETDFAVLAARIAKLVPNKPIKLTWSREEDFRRDYFRPAAFARYRGVLREGKAVLLDGKVAGSSVLQLASARSGRETDGADKEHVTGAYDQPYAIPNYRIQGYLSPERLPVGYWRSVGASFNVFFFDTFIDELAHAAGRDPLEFRLDMIRAEHAPSAKVLEAVADMSDWYKDHPEGTAKGVAFSYSHGSPSAQVIEVRQTARGIRISKAWIVSDVGVALDPGNIEAQLVGGCITGLSAACTQQITFADGQVEQENFYDQDLLRLSKTPSFEVQILENNRFIGGVGEIATPPAAPALGNALFALTGQRGRNLPFSNSFDLDV